MKSGVGVCASGPSWGRRVLSTALSAVLAVAFTVPGGAIRPPAAEATDGTIAGAGTQDSPYVIADYQDLVAFKTAVNGGDSYVGKVVKLGADIDFGSETWDKGIGDTSAHAFKGTFDGAGHTVTVNIAGGTNNYQAALFGYTTDATIRNLVTAGTVSGKANGVAGIVAKTSGTAITNCGNKATVTCTAGRAAGIVGYADSGTTFTACYNKGNVSAANQYAGGVFGQGMNSSSVVAKSCYNTGAVTNTAAYAGGIGCNAEFDNCYNAGKIKANRSSEAVGGGSSPSFMVSNYALDDSCSTIKTQVVKKTDIEMKDAAFVALLNEPAGYEGTWIAGSETSPAQDYPALTWEKAQGGESPAEPIAEKYAISSAQAVNGTFKVTVDGVEASEAAQGAKVTVEATPVQGYELDAISVMGADNNPVEVADRSFQMPAQAVTVTVAFKQVAMHTVSFETGEGSDVEPQSVPNGSKATRPETTPTRTGYVFSGWYADAQATREFDFDSPIKQATTVYAGWVEQRGNTFPGTAAGTQADPYLISTEADLAAFAASVNGKKPEGGAWKDTGTAANDYAGKVVKLAGDIVLTGAATPIGIGANLSTFAGVPKPVCFAGTFDGDGHTISNFDVSAESDPVYGNAAMTGHAAGGYSALFGAIAGATVKNVTVKAASSYKPGQNSAGLVAGVYDGENKIERSAFVGDISADKTVGGLVAVYPAKASRTAAKSLAILHCYHQGEVSGMAVAGGLVGSAAVTGLSIQSSYQAGKVSSASANAAANCGALCGSGIGRPTLANCVTDQDMALTGSNMKPASTGCVSGVTD